MGIASCELNLVSVITPCYNPDNAILNTIESVLGQTYQNFELIIIDDCSVEDKPEGFYELVDSDDRIKYVARSWNGGPAVTRNRGIEMAKGQFISFLDCDDSWHPNKLKLQVDFMLKNKIALSYTSYEVITSRGRVVGSRIPPKELSYSDVLKSNQIGCLTAMYDASLLGKVYMPNIAKRQDLGLWLRILKQVRVARGLTEQPLARYRVGCDSISSNKIGAMKYQWRLYREVENLPLVKSAKYFIHYAYRGMTRKV